MRWVLLLAELVIDVFAVDPGKAFILTWGFIN